MLSSTFLLLSTVLSAVTAKSTTNLANFTPLEDGTSTTSAFLAISTSPNSPPSACIDSCFNNATGGGKQGGCPGISGQYECICTFPEMMQSFETCMVTTCALDDTTVQQTLSNVQQICASCTPDGCNTFSISGNGGGTIAVSASEPPVSTPSSSLCYGSTQSAWTSSFGTLGGAVGGGFASAGPMPCGISEPSSSASFVGSTGVPVPDATSASGTSTTSSSAAAVQFTPHSGMWTVIFAFFGMTLGGALG
ncbi:hypothetical protein C8R43DRAFT_1159276 [Mycena crocata]|nr:hypothetical protein C8R43DRAFT_1159276 [Mycena crocata]